MAENREFDQQQDQLNQTPEQAQQFDKNKPQAGEQLEQDGNTRLQEDVETGSEDQPATGETQSGFVGSDSESDSSDDLINRDLDDQK